MIKNRKLNRLKDYNYSQNGYYFVTICTKGRMEWFGEITGEAMVLNQYGHIVKKQWSWLFEQYPYIQSDDFVVMPNHLHGILCIVGNARDSVGNGRDRSLRYKIKSLSELIGAFKTTSSKLIHNAGLSKFQWQKSFYDHIIRNDADLNRIRQYMGDNVYQWPNDRNNLKEFQGEPQAANHKD